MSRRATAILVAALCACCLSREGAAQHLYWVDAAFGATRMNIAKDDFTQVVNVNLPAYSFPQGVALDGVGGQVFHAELPFGSSHVNKGGLNGVAIAPIASGLSCLRGVAVDPAGGKVYWTHSNLLGGPAVQRANLDGSAVQVLGSFAPASLHAPRGIALFPGTGMAYFADFDGGAIYRMPMAGGTPVVSFTGLQGPTGVAIDHAAGKIYWTETTGNRIRRGNLNGSSVETLVTGLNGPNYIALDVAGGRMFWTEIGAPRIMRANLNGTNVVDLGFSAVQPEGIAYLRQGAADVTVGGATFIPRFALHGVSQSPSSGPIRVDYEIASPGMISLEVFELSGRRVRELERGAVAAGERSKTWDGRNGAGERVAAGSYFLRLQQENQVATRKIVVLH